MPFSNSHNHNKKLSQLNDFCSIRNNQFFFTEPRQTWINRKRINRDLDSLSVVEILVSGLLSVFSRTKIYWFLLLIIVDFFFVCVELNLLNKNNNLKIVLKSEWMVIELDEQREELTMRFFTRLWMKSIFSMSFNEHKSVNIEMLHELLDWALIEANLWYRPKNIKT